MRFISYFLLLTFVLLNGTDTRAQSFLQKVPGVVLETNQVKVAVSLKSGEGRENPQGIMVVVLHKDKGQPAQTFDWEQIAPEIADSAFFSFDGTKFSGIWLGMNFVPIQGNVDVQIGSGAVVRIDNTGPYLTINTAGTGTTPAILGFLGTTLVANLTGAAPVAILAANQLRDPEEARMLQRYVVLRDQLMIGDKPVKRAGIFLDPNREKSVCLKASALITREQLDILKAEKTPEKQVAKFESFAKETSRRWKEFIILRRSPASLIAYHLVTNNVMMIQPLNLKSSSARAKNVCIAEEIAL